MSYKISVKHLRPGQEERCLVPKRQDINFLNKQLGSRKVVQSKEHQQAVRRYICKLLKSKKSKENTERTVQSERNTSLDAINSSCNSVKGTYLEFLKGSKTKDNHFENSLKKLYKDIFDPDDHSQKKYMMSPPIPFLRKNAQTQTVSGELKYIDFQKNKYGKQIAATSSAFVTPRNESSLESIRNPMERNLNKVLEKYQNKITLDCNSGVVTPSKTDSEQCWGFTLTKLRDKIEKARNKYNKCEILINRIDTERVLVDRMQRKSARKQIELNSLKRVTKCNLSKIKLAEVKNENAEVARKEEFDPWSTEEIRLTDCNQIST